MDAYTAHLVAFVLDAALDQVKAGSSWRRRPRL
jgi:hypothetical protein